MCQKLFHFIALAMIIKLAAVSSKLSGVESRGRQDVQAVNNREEGQTNSQLKQSCTTKIKLTVGFGHLTN